MLTPVLYTNGGYISPEDEVQVYYEVTALLSIWKDIIIKHSNQKYAELPTDKQVRLYELLEDLNVTFDKNKSIAMQLDKIIVEMIIWAASLVSHKKALDEITSKTRNSMFNYFYHDKLVEAYLKVGEIKSAADIIYFMFNKEHPAYLYAVAKYDIIKYKDYPEFQKELTLAKKLINIKLLARKEKVDLLNVSYEDLLHIIEKVENEIEVVKNK